MKFARCFLFCVLLCQLNIARAQVDQTAGNKVWYSFILSKDINYRWSVNNFSLLAMRSFQQEFWFFQNSIGVNYRVNRQFTLSAGYGLSMYRYSSWWDNHYPQQPNFMNAMTFHSFMVGVQRRTQIGRKFLLKNEFTTQLYIPKFEKYQTRFEYSVRLAYRKKDLPLGVRPFVQGALYYFLNGVSTNYYDQNYNVAYRDSPDGLHRFRGKFGLTFTSGKWIKHFSTTLYFAMNREFNLPGIGNDQNILHPSRTGRTMLVTYPFNNYNIFGLQLGYSF